MINIESPNFTRTSMSAYSTATSEMLDLYHTIIPTIAAMVKACPYTNCCENKSAHQLLSYAHFVVFNCFVFLKKLIIKCRFQISRVKNLNSVFDLRSVAFRLFPPKAMVTCAILACNYSGRDFQLQEKSIFSYIFDLPAILAACCNSCMQKQHAKISHVTIALGRASCYILIIWI